MAMAKRQNRCAFPSILLIVNWTMTFSLWGLQYKVKTEMHAHRCVLVHSPSETCMHRCMCTCTHTHNEPKQCTCGVGNTFSL